MPGLSQTPYQGPWSHSPCAGGDTLWSREDNALSPMDSWGFKGSPGPFSQVAGKFPTTPPDHIDGNAKNRVPGDVKYAVAYPKDMGSTRKVCPRHLHNSREVTWNWRNQDSALGLCARLLHSPRANPSRNHSPHGLGKPAPASAIWGNPRHQKAVSLAVDRSELQCSPVQMTGAQFLDQQGWAQLHQTDRQARAE